MVNETKKIWGETIPICATCVRVPVMRAHAESINLTFEKPLSEKDAEELLKNAPGVSIINDRTNNRFPTPLDASHKDDVYVGRIRQVQPAGPYHLLGWSVGGILAQAMAVHLQSMGECVGSLTLLDAYPSDRWRSQPEPEANAALRALLLIAGHDPAALHGVVDGCDHEPHRGDVAQQRERLLRRDRHDLGE